MSYEPKEANAMYLDNENVQKLTPEQRAIWNEMHICREQIECILRSKPSMLGRGFWGVEGDVPVAAYLLAKACEYNDPFSVPFSAFAKDGVDQDIITLAENSHVPECWGELRKLILSHKPGIFRLVALLKDLNNDPMITPDSISALAEELLDVQPGEAFCDLCCGSGTVAMNIKTDVSEAHVSACDNDVSAIAVAKINNEMSNAGVDFSKIDVFELLTTATPERRYNKMFANYPFGMRLQNSGAGKIFLDRLQAKSPSISRATSSDWLFNLVMVEMLADDGKAVGVMTNGSTWNIIDTPIRKYFIENGFVECVIALPGKLFNGTGMQTSMVVLSKGNTTGVRLVDATEQYEPGRRTNELLDENIRAIVDATKADGDFSTFVSLDELRKNDYVLNIQRYSHSVQEVKNGAEFGSVIKRITRGAPLKATDLDSISSSVPTDMQYLMISNIRDGLIDSDLPYLSEIESKNEKYCLTNRCLILSKNGYPYKVAVAEVPDGKKIMANGNLYVVEIDEEKADPYYLAAYLSSEHGIAALKSITVGATIPNIGVDQLKKLIIPIPPLDQQKELGKHYRAVKDEIIMLQRKLERARNRMAHVFEEGGE